MSMREHPCSGYAIGYDVLRSKNKRIDSILSELEGYGVETFHFQNYFTDGDFPVDVDTETEEKVIALFRSFAEELNTCFVGWEAISLNITEDTPTADGDYDFILVPESTLYEIKLTKAGQCALQKGILPVSTTWSVWG